MIDIPILDQDDCKVQWKFYLFPSNNNIDFLGQSGAEWVPQQLSSSFNINPLHGKIKIWIIKCSHYCLALPKLWFMNEKQQQSKNWKCKVLYFSYKQNFYKIYMHIYIKEKLKNISYTFLVKQAVPSKISAWLFLNFLKKQKCVL